MIPALKKPSSPLFLIGGIILLACAPLWYFLSAPYLTRIPSDFTYTASIISLDNFYDEDSRSFTGDIRSTTRFIYRSEGESDGVLSVKNIFDVRTVDGDPIFAVERIYGIDTITKKHVPGSGDKDRSGYLFAPRNLKKGEPFTYWHVNYDGPARMQFIQEETLFGLPVYRYGTSYEDVVIDQTDQLGHLPGVGITRGVVLEPQLQIWIEPVTGHLVKYKDKTTAFYYDLATGDRIAPWNSFSNTFQRSSILEQVQTARHMKLVTELYAIVLPLLFAALGSALLFLGYGRTGLIKFVGVLTMLGLVWYTSWILFTPSGEKPTKIGIVRWVPKGNVEYDRNIQGFKDALARAGYIDGESVEYYEHFANADEKLQREAIGHFREIDVDLIYSLTTPGTLIAKSEVRDNTPIVFSIVTYPVEAGLIDSVQHSGNNLVGTRNWVPIEKQLAVFREIVPTISSIGFVHREGEPNSIIQLNEMRSATTLLGIDVVEIAGSTVDDLSIALHNADGVDSVYSACDTLVQGQAEELIIAYAHANRLPSFSCNRSGPTKGDLVGVVADVYDIGRLAGEKAVLILEGVTPTSITTDTIPTAKVYVNRKTADLLDIVIPQTILLQSSEIIDE